MNKRSAYTALAALTLGLAACGGTDSAADVVETSAAAPPAPTEETTAATDPAPSTTDAADSPAEQPTTTEATATDSPESTEPVTSEPEAASPSEVISTDLEMLSVLSISLGAGSGEYNILLDRLPEGFERFKVSTAGADGYCNSRVLDTQDAPDGVVVTVYPECAGTTFGVAWVHVDGRRSDITYRDCSSGITFETSC